MKPKKGQGTIEYLIILSVIIVIGLIIAAIMGWHPGSSIEITINQSKAYWKSLNNISIIDYSLSDYGILRLNLQNNSTKKLKLTDIIIDDKKIPINKYIYNNTTIEIPTFKTYQIGEIFQKKLTLVYNDSYILQHKITGKKPLIGKIQPESPYYQIITISSSTSAQNYSLRIILQKNEYTNSDFSNVSFFDLNKNPLPFWKEYYDDNNYAIFWVKTKVPGKIKLVYLPWIEDANNTFLYFTDFDSIDDWDINSENYNLSNSTITFYKGGASKELNFQMQDSYEVKAKIKFLTNTPQLGGSLAAASSKFITSGNLNGDALNLLMQQNSHVGNWVADGTSNNYNCTGVGHIININVWERLGEKYTYSGVTNSYNEEWEHDNGCGWAKPLKYIIIGRFDGLANYTIQPTEYDWLFIRKFISPEPNYSFSSIFKEE